MEIIISIVHFINSAITLYFLGRIFEWKNDRMTIEKGISIVLFTILYAIFSKINHMNFFHFYVEFLLGSILSYIYLHVYREGTVLEKVYWITLIQSMSIYGMIISSTLIEQLLTPSLYFLQNITQSGLFKISLMIIFPIIKYLLLFSITPHSPKLNYLRGFPLIFSIIVNLLSLGVIDYLNRNFDSSILVISASIILAVNIGYFLIIKILTKNISDLVTIDLDYQNIKLKMKYYDEIELINKEVKKYKHDFANHLNFLYYLIEVNKAEEAKTYIEQMGQDLKKINKVFYFIETGNESLDFILNSKLLIAREKGIEVHTNIGQISELFISNVDLCTLLANLLDNSIEACERFEKENTFINVKITVIKKNLAINIKNSSNPVKVDEEGNYMTSKKSGDHGLGMHQINRIIQFYDGFISRKYQNDIFETNILLSKPVE